MKDSVLSQGKPFVFHILWQLDGHHEKLAAPSLKHSAGFRITIFQKTISANLKRELVATMSQTLFNIL